MSVADPMDLLRQHNPTATVVLRDHTTYDSHVSKLRFEEVLPDDLPERIQQYKAEHFVVAADDPQEIVPVDELERRYILRVLKVVGGNKSRAAQLLGLETPQSDLPGRAFVEVVVVEARAGVEPGRVAHVGDFQKGACAVQFVRGHQQAPLRGAFEVRVLRLHGHMALRIGIHPDRNGGRRGFFRHHFHRRVRHRDFAGRDVLLENAVELRGAMWTGVDLHPGDVVTSVNGFKIERESEANKAFQSLEVASEIRVSVIRDGKPLELRFDVRRLGAACHRGPHAARATAGDGSRPRARLHFGTLGTTLPRSCVSFASRTSTVIPTSCGVFWTPAEIANTTNSSCAATSCFPARTRSGPGNCSPKTTRCAFKASRTKPSR